jgi:hypothetical protein
LNPPPKKISGHATGINTIWEKIIYKQVRSFLARDSILDSRETCIKCAEEISDNIRARQETSPKKNNLARLSQQMEVSAPMT